MKIDELLKRLENIKINENKIDERRKIAEYLAQKLSIKNSLGRYYYIMTKYKKILHISSYENLLDSDRISPDDAYVYVSVHNANFPASYYFPFLIHSYPLVYAYLSKLGFKEYLREIRGLEDPYHVAPATGLKYISTVIRYLDNSHVVIEIIDIDNASNNMNLLTLIRDISTKYIIASRADLIALRLESQELFTGYNFIRFISARDIINRYYRDHDTSLAKDVEAIRDAYNRIFKPYRLIYDLNTKQFQVSDNNENG